MKNLGGNVVNKFRDTFKIVSKDALRWFPGHMTKGIKQMQQQLKNVDCIVEVHDARVPISGYFADFTNTLTGLKPHIVILNKVDLADVTLKEPIITELNKRGQKNVIFTNVKDEQCNGVKQILPLAKKLIKASDRFNRSQESSYAMMIIGVPNVGKSSLINRLRNNNLRKTSAAAVGAIAGITRSVQTRIKVAEDPDVYLLDTPGILIPKMPDTHTGLKLALIGCLQDHLVGLETLADFLLFWLNKHERFEYVWKIGLREPVDDIMYVLTFIAAKNRSILRIRNAANKYVQVPNIQHSAEHFISLFRKGEFGRYCLDEELLDLPETMGKNLERK